MKKKNICFFGAASPKVKKEFVDEVEQLGEYLGEKFNLVFGGGASGLMGAMARGFQKSHAHITGVVPTFISEFEEVYEACHDLIYVDTMHERKKIMKEQADLFVVGPGGLGTMDELFEVLTDKNLDRYNKSVLLLNLDSFYDEIIQYINQNLNSGIINHERFNDFYICDSIEEVKNLLPFICET